jgi:hypothetical protein
VVNGKARIKVVPRDWGWWWEGKHGGSPPGEGVGLVGGKAFFSGGRKKLKSSLSVAVSKLTAK